MLRTYQATAEYLFIRISILFLHSIPPISILYSTLVFLVQYFRLSLYLEWVPYPIQIWLIAEAIFFTAVIVPLRYSLHRSPISHRPLSAESREKLFRNCFANVSNLHKYLRRWLMVSEDECIKRDNAKEFVRWAFFDPENKQDREDQHDEEIETYTTEVEKLLGQRFSPGRTDVKGLGQLLHETTGSHRSLLWYTCISVVDTATHCTMLYNGFHYHRSSLSRFFTVFPFRPLTIPTGYRSPAQHLTYWHRRHTSKTRLPVLFIHGIGVGLYPYMKLLRDLNKELETGIFDDGEVGIIALEIMPVSSRLTHPALEKDIMSREVLQIMQYHGWDRFVLVSHSYGSIIAGNLLKSELFAARIGPMIFIDPVTFLLHLPDVAYNFTAREPVRADEYVLWYFGSKDIGVAHMLARRFSWVDNIIWKEDLGTKCEENKYKGRNVTVVLSGKDAIVDAETVAQYLVGSSSDASPGKQEVRQAWKGRPWVGSSIELLWYEKLGHGQVFNFENTRRPVIEAISVYSDRG
ncbi:hypothetical protein BJX76DRAFT_339452 [Aspergillus varians]